MGEIGRKLTGHRDPLGMVQFELPHPKLFFQPSFFRGIVGIDRNSDDLLASAKTGRMTAPGNLATPRFGLTPEYPCNNRFVKCTINDPRMKASV